MALMEDFKPSDKYILMGRDKYQELKKALEDIRTAITVEKASEIAEKQLEFLKKKYDRPAYADALEQELAKKSQQASQQGK